MHFNVTIYPLTCWLSTAGCGGRTFSFAEEEKIIQMKFILEISEIKVKCKFYIHQVFSHNNQNQEHSGFN